MSADDFLNAGPGEPDVRGGRYHLPDPATGTVRSWTRASNVGAVLADRFALERWRTRRLLSGLGERRDLLDLLWATAEYDNAKLDEVAETALQVAATTEAANRGTAIHEVHLRVDRGLPVPDDLAPYAHGYRAALERAGLTAVIREARVINTGLEVAGRLDVIYREPDGTLVVGDAKSTDHLQLAAPEIAPQLAVYATADWIELNGDGKGWTHMGEMRTDYGIVVHVDRESGAVALYRVDLFLGAYGANLSNQVREYRKMGKALLQPYVRVEGQPEARRMATPPVAQEGRHLAAVPDPAPDLFTRADAAAAEEHANAHREPEQRTEVPATVDAAHGATRPALISPAALAKLTKAQVQQYLREHGHPDDLAHQKSLLIARAQQLGLTAADGTTYAATRPAGPPDRAEVNGPIGGSDPTNPRDPAFAHSVGSRIAAAKTIAELGAVHTYVVRVGGDQAWTDSMAAAARGRANALDAANPNHAALSRVLACQSQEDLAGLWNELTVGGSRPEGWPAEVDAAARERMRQIEAAKPPAPSNPFGGAQ